jgi:hypothetical protein
MITIAFLAAALIAEPAPASIGCAPSPSQPAAVLELAPTETRGQRNAQMLVSAALLLEIGKADEARARAAAEPCLLGSAQVAGGSWELAGGDRAFVRRAVSSDPGKPVAFIYPFADLLALMQASKTGTPPPRTRYVLVTSTGSLDTLWRFYEDLPSDAQLRTDLSDVVSGRTRPVASTDIEAKKVTLMIGPNAH